VRWKGERRSLGQLGREHIVVRDDPNGRGDQDPAVNRGIDRILRELSYPCTKLMPMMDALAGLRKTAAECADARAWAMSDADLLSCLDAVHEAEQVLAAAKAHLVCEIGGRGLHRRHGAASLAAWLRDRLRIGIATAGRLVALTAEVDRRPGLDTALSNGVVNADQVPVIASAVVALPDRVGADLVDAAEARLIGDAACFEPSTLRRLGAQVLTHIAPEVAEELEAEALRRQEEKARLRRGFDLRSAGDGRVRLTGWLDREDAAVVNAALDPLCSPRTGPDGDTRTATQRRADALVEVCQLALRTDQLPEHGGERPQVVVTVPFDVLREQVGAAVLDTGERLSAEQVRRLACDAKVLPAVLGGDGQVLDLGMTRRLFAGAVRRALVLRDGGCCFPSCDRPSRWCDGHHLLPWSLDGPTNVDNGVLLCRHHHRLIHQGDWEVRLGADRRPEFIPPAYVDPLRRPRRNTYHRRP
jgi:hypothetical protein